MLIAAAVSGAFLLGLGNVAPAMFAVAPAGAGLLTAVWFIVAMDSYGPAAMLAHAAV